MNFSRGIGVSSGISQAYRPPSSEMLQKEIRLAEKKRWRNARGWIKSWSNGKRAKGNRGRSASRSDWPVAVEMLKSTPILSGWKAEVDVAMDSLTISHNTPTNQKKKGRQQKRKDKRAADIEALRSQAALEAESMPDLRQKELGNIKVAVGKLGLELVDIPADGHCLYRAIGGQLGTPQTYQDLRRQTASHLRTRREQFAPFLTNTDGDALNDGEYEKYCETLENTAVWGGDVEIQALSQILNRPIHVHQSDSPVLKVNEEYGGEPIRISYHRHYYRLGAHYNLLRSTES
ncbi:OTU-domain-containing protein [Gonapodya prolifera JEL478]|uniref:OTU-domain-containing protein n=1 Tax=Gonapodya prolifera (strain JEL478) TaxID=1344416 RepID=A0A139A1P8_GONPJ|nr:OTU-domain-containing protein [Gonapodya prolifera JEL478]|eukprot:KXS10706.1 OTU-domain-containing protein [Gonapodya prolifera JEL478]